MSAPRLSRADGHGRAAAPVRLLHLGLGGFFRAHQAAYTDGAPDADRWGIAAFAGRSSTALAQQLNEQGGLYTLVERGAKRDDDRVIASVTSAHVAADHEAWLGYFRSPELAAVTITVTEAGYRALADGRLDAGHPQVRADAAAMRTSRDAAVVTAPARLVAGLAARASAGLGPVAVVPCDNQADNGAVAAAVIRDFAHLVDPALAREVTTGLHVVTTMVDRITPRTEPSDLGLVATATGHTDECPVVTEPFSEWVLAGGFPAGRPRWESAGATIAEDITPYEHRKLWLLNGGHSLLAYLGPLRGHETVADAAGDEVCEAWLREWWSAAVTRLDQPSEVIEAYLAQLVERFANPRIRHRLDQIAADGSQKLAIRVVPVLRAARAATAMPLGATRVLAGWLRHLRGYGVPVVDADAVTLVELASGPLSSAVPRVLAVVAPDLAGDPDVIAAVQEQYDEVAQR